MKFGFSLSNNQGIEGVQSIIRLARRAHALGFDSRYLAEQVQAAGRQAADIPVSISLPMYSARAGRCALGLDPAEMVQNIRAFASLGVDRVVISPSTGEPQKLTYALEVIARDVMPACR